MRKSRFTEEQIAFAIKKAESGTKVPDICRKMGISLQTYYSWRKKYSGMGVAELRRLKTFEEENARLKKLVPDLPLDKHMLQELIAKKL